MKVRYLKKRKLTNMRHPTFNGIHSIQVNELPVEIQERIKTRERHLQELYDKIGIPEHKRNGKLCSVCGNPLTDDQEIYCSKECRIEGLKIYGARYIPGTLHIVKFCEVCGQIFVTTKDKLTLYTGRTCNKKSCKAIIRTKEVMKQTKKYQCVFCETEFYTMYPSLFCGDSCRYAYAYFCNGIFTERLLAMKWPHNVASEPIYDECDQVYDTENQSDEQVHSIDLAARYVDIEPIWDDSIITNHKVDELDKPNKAIKNRQIVIKPPINMNKQQRDEIISSWTNK